MAVARWTDMDADEQMDRTKTVAQLQRIVSDLHWVERRMRHGDASNLTYRHLFSVLVSTRALLHELDPDGQATRPA